ncbi:hypothetical protein WDW86_10165 [Bdellovibrionota bacterium FG-2]
MMNFIELSRLSHVDGADSDQEFPVFVTEAGRSGVVFKVPIIDTEGSQFEAWFTSVQNLISRLKPGVTLRVIQKTFRGSLGEFGGSRSDAIKRLGYLESEVFIGVETSGSMSLSFLDWFRAIMGKKLLALKNQAAVLRASVDFSALRTLGSSALNEAHLRHFFPSFCTDLVATKRGIDTGEGLIGVLRLSRQGVQGVDQRTLAVLREQLVAPYEISVVIRKLPDVRAQYILRRKRAQIAASKDTLAPRVYQTTDDLTAETSLSGKGLVELEWLLVLVRSSEKDLREDLEACARVLSDFGDVYIEVQGAAASFAATQLGADPHHMFFELDEVAAYYLPMFSRGEEKYLNYSNARAVPLHRQDGSLYFFDLWRKGYDGANCIINGRRGKGKSVLANLISTALLNDPAVRMIKVDVGGSYTKECALVGGKHIQFNLAEPSGINPFALLNQTEFVQDAAVILSGFISTLLLESRETILTKEMLGSIEKAVLAYAESRPLAPSLPGFMAAAHDLPRRGLLERFSPGGVFSNVIKERPDGDVLNGDLASRYIYFNFERLQNAANEDFAQAVMAAVIAATNLEVLRAGDARRGAKNRVVFFADETPFFIQRNGRFFKLTTANFRKFGHATILIAQTTRDFELVKEGGETDYGILLNSPIRFLYQVDDDAAVFAERLALTPRQIAEIQALGRSDEFREVFLQDELGGRVLRVAVTPEEYWRVTSSRSDNEKIEALLTAVPGLRLQEAIRCLSVG